MLLHCYSLRVSGKLYIHRLPTLPAADPGVERSMHSPISQKLSLEQHVRYPLVSFHLHCESSSRNVTAHQVVQMLW